MTWERGWFPSPFLSRNEMFTDIPLENTLDKYEEMRLHMEQLLSTSIIDIDIPIRIAIPLDEAGIRRLRDLVRLSRADLIKIGRIGKKSVDEIERILHRFDLSLEMK